MIRVRQILIDINSSNDETIKNAVSKKLRVNTSDIISFKINKQSIDARKKPTIYYVYEIDVEVKNEDRILKHNKSNDILKKPKEKYEFKTYGEIILKNRPVIVGSGPAGLFCAYELAEHDYNPIIIERGSDVDTRVKDVEEFWKTNKLNTESNVQFGEGGAGTFSDGKLNTLVRDPFFRGKEVLNIFVKFGAPKDILYVNKPHIGTDILRTVVKNMREYIKSKGGEFRYNTKLTNINYEENKIKSIEVNNSEIINTDVLVLALGHSARDTFEMLLNKIDMEQKPFAMGIRIIHNQSMINKSMYGSPENKLLGPASYKLTYHSSNNRGVYSFCMCPGGYVVNASSEPNKIAINGMSNHARESACANSAIVVTINPNDCGNSILSGMEFQRKLEESAYKLGTGSIPIQTFKDFCENRTTTNLGSVEPIIKGSYKLTNLNEILPEFMSEALKEAIQSFEHKIKGFSNGDAILAAIESRTSSPIKMIRNEECISNIEGIYPCGEGAGYAGGITSAAMDGLLVSESIAKKYI